MIYISDTDEPTPAHALRATSFAHAITMYSLDAEVVVAAKHSEVAALVVLFNSDPRQAGLQLSIDLTINTRAA